MLLFYQEKYEDIPETFDTLKATFGIKEEMRKLLQYESVDK